MRNRQLARCVVALASLITVCQSDTVGRASPTPSLHEAKRTPGGIHLPIVRKAVSGPRKRSVSSGAIGLGDFQDVTYNVLVQVGETRVPVVLDTGSSDLWILSSACQGGCSAGKVPLYPLATFHPANLDAMLMYGDSLTGTHAIGPIGYDIVSVAGLGLQNQYFAAINNTNTSVLETGSAGIFGLGFPINSALWTDIYTSQHQSLIVHRDVPAQVINSNSRFPDRLKNLVTRWFPKNNMSNAVMSSPDVRSKRQLANTSELQSSFATIGPLIPRLVAQGMLDSPMFSVALQRDTIEIGGNEGMLSIGTLPPTVKSESLTWVPVRGYPPDQGGLKPPPDAPGEVYPIAWEIPVDDVYFDGIKLPRSTLSSPNISLSALIDTGNSLIRGPPDVISHIQTMLGGPHFACSPPHILAFQIGGQLFIVDPRDFVTQVHPGNPDLCAANLVSTDVPVAGGSGYLYSWNLGDPFLKGVLAAFHYGSLIRPSQNPPRIGLLSTFDLNAGKALCDDKHKAEIEHKDFPMIAEPAPASLPPSLGTGVGGVPLASPPSVTQSGVTSLGGGSAKQANGDFEDVRIGLGTWSVLAGLMAWAAWRTLG
ncbi:acid protease [Paxillus ammoniavirescens]|nr:acid protease [Paxillus ammoniavirescens]